MPLRVFACSCHFVDVVEQSCVASGQVRRPWAQSRLCAMLSRPRLGSPGSFQVPTGLLGYLRSLQGYLISG